MRIIHIVSAISSTNFGIWNAAIFGSIYLKKTYNVDSELWICSRTKSDTLIPEIPFYFFKPNELSINGIRKWILNFPKDDILFVTHGAWLKPSIIGFLAKKAGYKWIYLSHGMLEPWAMKNDWLKKKIYFGLVERPMSKNADVIRAVSRPEENNLRRFYKNKITLVFNGVRLEQQNLAIKPINPIVYLFLARLHFKKGILPLVKAWKKVMDNNSFSKLIIVGPDEGELKKIAPYIDKNIEYLGPLFGEDKKRILEIAHYYLLPSFSEGFPSSVVEAMSFGAIPVISDGCNFPEVFEEKLGYKINPDQSSIENVLNTIQYMSFDYDLSRRNINYVKENLSEETIGDKLFCLFNDLLYCKDKL